MPLVLPGVLTGEKVEGEKTREEVMSFEGGKKTTPRRRPIMTFALHLFFLLSLFTYSLTEPSCSLAWCCSQARTKRRAGVLLLLLLLRLRELEQKEAQQTGSQSPPMPPERTRRPLALPTPPALLARVWSARLLPPTSVAVCTAHARELARERAREHHQGRVGEREREREKRFLCSNF